ncbi:MAG: hemin receptor [Prevotellaceae bacterium]|nr:hemin receptor [Prevotellaceae bacterium]
MKKIILFAFVLTQAMVISAQETYEMATIETPELNGTARYVGMGGAMEALGADISTISTNPAGIGLFRRSMASVSFGFVSQSGASETNDVSPTRMSFDQAGFVLSTNTSTDKVSFFNFAFNYTKSRNFSQILSAANEAYLGSSQNKQTFGKIRTGIVGSADDYTYNSLDYLYYNVNNDGFLNAFGDTCYDATNYDMERGTKGYIGNYEFNVSGNIQNKFFLGLTFGIKDVNYESSSAYGEALIDESGNRLGIGLYDERVISGTGFDLKAGAIIRPIDNSPFRFGVWVSTPTWYSLRSSSYTMLKTSDSSTGYLDMNESYKYKFYTPWKFGASVGHTIGTNIALGASWEYADYGATNPRIDNGSYIDEWGYSYTSTSKDTPMSRNVKASLKGVHTLKIGGEYKPIPELALRLGYNYVSAMYKDNGMKDPSVWSLGNYYTSQSDFTNWKATNRITAGVGHASNNFYADLAYQCSLQKGDFYPFTNGDLSYTTASGKNVDLVNIPQITEVKNNRHQLLLTLGYKF